MGVAVEVGGMKVAVNVGEGDFVSVAVNAKRVGVGSLTTSVDSETGKLQAVINKAVKKQKTRFIMAFILHQERKHINTMPGSGRTVVKNIIILLPPTIGENMRSDRKILLSLTAVLIILFSSQSPSAHAQSDLITFAVIGDYGLAGQPLLDVSNLIKSWNPGFIVTLGDNNYPNGQSYTIDDNIGQYFHEYIFKYKGKYGSGSPTRRFYPSLGNHDWGSTEAKPYFEFFGDVKRLTYYEFVQGPVHFFVLDSDPNEPDGVTSTSQQAIWLKKALAASTSPFNVIVFHHAPYSSGQHGPTNYMRWPFKEWGADAVLTGHDHIYERLLVNGIPYFVNGIGGAELYDIRAIAPESQVRFNQDFGAMRVEATSAYMKFQMFTRAGVLVDEYTIGGSAPSVTSITRQNASPTNAGSVNFQVTFSESVSGVDAADFILATNLPGASIANVTGLGNSYTVSVNTGSGDGNLRLDLADNDTILDSLNIPLGGVGAANGNFTSVDFYSIDRSSPAVTSIAPANLNPTNAASVDFAITFSEPVNGVDITDFAPITNNGAILKAITGSGANYIVTAATGAGNDTLRLDFIDNGTVSDLAGNITSIGFTNGIAYTIDRSAPFVTSITPIGKQPNASSVEYTVSFSEAVTDVDGGDFFLSTINRAAITNVTGAGSQYVVSIALQPGSDSIRLDMNDNDSIVDGFGNPLGGPGMGNGNIIGGVFNIAIDTPITTSIIRATASPTNAASVDYIVTFSEPVSGVDAGDFIAGNGAFISNVSNSNPFYIVTVNTSASNGEVKLDLIDNDSIVNEQGITLGGNGAGNANFTSGESYFIDRTAPQITSIVRASGNPAINPTADFIVTFSEAVNGVEGTDFVLAQSNVIKSSVVTVQNVNPFYWVTVNTGIGSGTIRLDLFDNGNITDLAGNPLVNNTYVLGESFTIAKTPVDFSAPGINSPSKPLTNNPYIPLMWSAVWNAQAYEVFIASDSGFSKSVLMQVTAETTYIPQLPLPDGLLYMRVRAYSPDLNPGKWSKTFTFTVDTTPPPPPTIRTPANGSAVPRRPWLIWAAANGAAKYQVEVDNNADFSSIDFSATTTKTTLQTKTLLLRTHYWRVRSVDAAGNWSNWSQVFSLNAR